jgi:dipeptide/tripeptide permease
VSGTISNAINPFWVVTLTFPLVWFWKWLDNRGKEPATPTKMAVGMFLTGASFFILFAAAKAGEATVATPDMYARGSFRVTDRSLENLQAQGVPADVIEKLQAKDAAGNFVLKGKKLSADDTGTGEQKLQNSLRTVLGDQQAAQYAPAILGQSFLFTVSPFWLILAYGVVTLGELMLSPMGLSLVSKVAPIRMRGLMMGGWFVATAIGNKLTMIGVYWDQWYQSTFFAVLGASALFMAVVLVLLLKPLKKAMPGV